MIYIPNIAIQILALYKLKKKKMNNLITIAQEVKEQFDKYAKIHHDKGDIDKRDINIGFSDRLRDAIRQEKDNIREEEEMLSWSANEIQSLRNKNEKLKIQVDTFNACVMLARSNQGYGDCLTQGAQEDIVGRIRKHLEEKQASRINKNTIDEILKV